MLNTKAEPSIWGCLRGELNVLCRFNAFVLPVPLQREPEPWGPVAQLRPQKFRRNSPIRMEGTCLRALSLSCWWETLTSIIWGCVARRLVRRLGSLGEQGRQLVRPVHRSVQSCLWEKESQGHVPCRVRRCRSSYGSRCLCGYDAQACRMPPWPT